MRNFQGRVGREFEHERYASQLSDLRDELRMGLSDGASEEARGKVAELAEQIRELRDGNAVEAPPERTGARKAVRAERPVTARIRERIGTPEPAAVESPMPEEPLHEPPVPVVIAMPEPMEPANGHMKAVEKRRHSRPGQLRLF